MIYPTLRESPEISCWRKRNTTSRDGHDLRLHCNTRCTYRLFTCNICFQNLRQIYKWGGGAPRRRFISALRLPCNIVNPLT